MIETKYGLKYSMPHSLVHIVDNSQYTGDLPVTIVDDPSTYSTIVVSGSPLGEDNKIVSINRSDILGTAYGMNSLSTEDIEKYGQGITYPMSLIEQGAPVKFMRVTPEGSEYATSCILVQWRVDPSDNKLHVRFKDVDFPQDLVRSAYKNTSRMNDAIIKSYKSDNVSDDDNVTSTPWKQRVFINNIAAGRGSEYNKFVTAINLTSQAKRPPNVRYEFVTVDTSTDQVVEQFYASLINVNNSSRTDAIDTVNVTVGKRAVGSSIIIPYLNESAVREVYNDYISNFKMQMNSSNIISEYNQNVLTLLTINTFDMIFGNYIYNGTDTSTKLPYYQVDMYDTEIVTLSASNIITNDYNYRNVTCPTDLYNYIEQYMFGVTRNGDSTYVGDLYLTTNGNSIMYPKISIVTAINQYTGNVTSLTIPKVYPIIEDTDTSNKTGMKIDKDNTSSQLITAVIDDLTYRKLNTDESTGRITVIQPKSTTISNLITNNYIKDGNIIAVTNSSSSTFDLFIVGITEGSSSFKLTKYYPMHVYDALDRKSHSGGTTGTGNAIAWTSTDTAYSKTGAAVINVSSDRYHLPLSNIITINEYGGSKLAVRNVSFKVGTVPTSVNITDNIVGESFDILSYPHDNIISWAIKGVEINAGASSNSGTNYSVGDEIIVPIIGNETADKVNDEYTAHLVIKVTEVNSAGGVVHFDIIKNDPFYASGDSSDNVPARLYASGVAADTDTVPLPLATINTAIGDNVGSGLYVNITGIDILEKSSNPTEINRYAVTGTVGSIYVVQNDTTVIPSNYYSESYGINVTSENGGVKIDGGSTGFFDEYETMNSVEYKWRYSARLVQAFKGDIDPRIMSPTRVPAKFLFDAGYNTIIGTTIVPYLTYTPTDIINSSIIFTDDEKEEILLSPSSISGIKYYEDIDVKQAMYDLMEYRCYQGIPEDKRPIGPGSGLSLHLDSGVTDANTAMLINTSFAKRFNNPNASWDIGGYTEASTGVTYTYTKQIVDNLIKHCKTYSINKPYVGKYSSISKSSYSSYFPDIDTTDWELRELLYNSGGNAWIADVNGNLTRRSQRTLLRDAETSDLIQESNMRTLSLLVYLLQNKIDSYLLEYNDDGVLKTLSDEVNNIFSNWVGNLVDGLDITFTRDTNIDGGDIVICYCNVVFRGLILRVPIIVNVNRRES